jgi:hypothetical protein
LKQFQGWIAERDAAGDWLDYVYRGKLNRTEIALECEFALAVLRQNPAVKESLMILEARLQTQGIFSTISVGEDGTTPEIATEESDAALNRRIVLAKISAEKRIKKLEEHNSSLLAEVSHLREKLRGYKHIDEYLSSTGRMVRP